MGVEWYDMIARRNGGYKGRSLFTIEGQSSEDLFEERLINMLPNFKTVLDAGCGHGDFTIRMSKYAKRIIGIDNSIEMIKIAQKLLESNQVDNVEFLHASTKLDLPFTDEQFDLIYDRRGPTSIINHSRILRTGGTIFGIHNNVDVARERLVINGFKDIKIEEYNEAIIYFPNELEFAKYISDTPGNPDYTLPEYREEFQKKLNENLINGRIGVKELKYIWKAIKP
jgi:SAM-dependent methyltransferase